jgi:uncharacterized repeat protein (TIGR03803 family)
VQASDGNFYGTTTGGGGNSNEMCGSVGCGTVFEVTPAGALKTLYSFCAQSDCTDGAVSFASLVPATNGRLYGTTADGGANGDGTVFNITRTGNLTTLHSFDFGDGYYPTANLVQDTSGSFYGTTAYGGTGTGTVFGMNERLGPFVETLPAKGPIGAAVKILGTDLMGATSVTFNGTSATFTIVSPSELATTVPSGATTSDNQ